MKTAKQFITFASMGAIGTTAHYAILVFLVQAIHTDPVFATTAGFVVGAAINYALNYRITFNSSKSHRETIIKFFTVAGFGAVINSVIMLAGITIFTFHYLAIQLIATCVVLIFNFIANKYWTFADKPPY